MRILLPLFLLALVVLFVLGVVTPRRSRRVQAKVDRKLEQGKAKSDRSAGRLGDWTSWVLGLTKRAADKASRGGRAVRAWLRR